MCIVEQSQEDFSEEEEEMCKWKGIRVMRDKRFMELWEF